MHFNFEQQCFVFSYPQTGLEVAILLSFHRTTGTLNMHFTPHSRYIFSCVSSVKHSAVTREKLFSNRDAKTGKQLAQI